jgi:murein DD-endopeptidase
VKKVIAVLLGLLALGPGVLLVGVAAVTAGCGVPGASTVIPGDPRVPETTRIVMPLPTGSYSLTDGFGMRQDPIRPWLFRMHWGTDFSADDGTPIFAVADGLVLVGRMIGDTGQITILHTVDGQSVATVYLHMWEDSIFVRPGQTVMAGQVIGAVGSSGYSTGSHLHLEVRPGGASSEAVDALPWLRAHHAEGIDSGPDRCASPESPIPIPTPTPAAAAAAVMSVGGRSGLS